MIKRITSLFSHEEVNRGRQVELDIAKGMAIIFMVLCHTFEVLSDRTNYEMKIILDNILGGPFAAPVFMFCMGMGICYSKKNTPKDLLKRGLKILVVGCILNICRTFIPQLMKYAILKKEISMIGTICTMCSIDILQFAGLTFIAMSLFKYFDAKPGQIVIVSLVFSVLGGLLRNVSTGRFLTDYLCGFFWRSYDASYFPFFNWLIFPTCGYLFGKLWLHCEEKKQFYLLSTPICGIISGIFLFVSYPSGDVYDNNLYYGVNTVNALFFIMIVMTVLGICYFISFIPQIFTRPLRWMSYHINSIYCIHWTILGILARFTAWDIPEKYCPNPFVVPAGILLLLFSCLILAVYLHIRKVLVAKRGPDRLMGQC